MQTLLNPACNSAGAVLSSGENFHEFDLQCLRILRCTAKAMAGSAGGLRFSANTRPWLEGLHDGRQAPVSLPAALD
jgi:hypothetical protein